MIATCDAPAGGCGPTPRTIRKITTWCNMGAAISGVLWKLQTMPRMVGQNTNTFMANGDCWEQPGSMFHWFGRAIPTAK